MYIIRLQICAYTYVRICKEKLTFAYAHTYIHVCTINAWPSGAEEGREEKKKQKKRLLYLYPKLSPGLVPYRLLQIRHSM